MYKLRSQSQWSDVIMLAVISTVVFGWKDFSLLCDAEHDLLVSV